MPTKLASIWGCQECMNIIVNDDDSSISPPSRREHVRLSVNNQGDITLGHEHQSRCTVDKNDMRCDCNYIPFSEHPCGVCDTTAAGERYAFTVWIP